MQSSRLHFSWFLKEESASNLTSAPFQSMNMTSLFSSLTSLTSSLRFNSSSFFSMDKSVSMERTKLFTILETIFTFEFISDKQDSLTSAYPGYASYVVFLVVNTRPPITHAVP